MEYYRQKFDALYPEKIQIDGEEYGYNRSSNKLRKFETALQPLFDKHGKKLKPPTRMGLAYKDGKPVAVPYGSVKGRTMAGQLFGLLGL